ncbi:MAG: PAS domain S-box protein, partial [Promethearchaeota archaeon]
MGITNEELNKIEHLLNVGMKLNFEILNNSPNPIIIINLDTSIEYVNPKLEEITGFSAK